MFLRDAVGLQKLEGRFSVLVKRGNLAVNGRIFWSQQFQGLDKLGVIIAEIYLVARIPGAPLYRP
jgi:hypothetical protein